MRIEKKDAFTRETAKINMHISEVAYAHLDSTWHSPSARAPYARIYFIEEGKGEIEADGRVTELVAGNICIIPPFYDYAYRCDGRLEKLYCHVNLMRYDRTDLLADIGAPVLLSDRMSDVLRAVELWRRGDLASALSLKELLYTVLCEALTLAGAGREHIRTYSELIRGAVSYVDKNLRATLTASEIASALFVSESRLQKLFRAEMGLSLGRYIAARTLAVAEEQLRLTTRTIPEISDSLGYCDRFYFSRLFRAHFGVAPATYRRNLMT